MRDPAPWFPLAAIGVGLLGTLSMGQEPASHLNPMIESHIQKKPVFGLYAPTNLRQS